MADQKKKCKYNEEIDCKWDIKKQCDKYDDCKDSFKSQHKKVCEGETCGEPYGCVTKFVDLSIEEMAEYDFKNEIGACIGSVYKKAAKKEIAKIVVASTSIEKFLLYKKYKKFDCDNSKNNCSLSKDAYSLLWGWEKEKGSFGKCCMNENGNCTEEFLWGGDAMNSVMTTLKKYMNKCTDYKKWLKQHSEIKDKYEGYIKYFKRKKVETSIISQMDRFSMMTNTLGNFVLVPAYYNPHRYSVTKDYWDLSLFELSRKEEIWEQNIRGEMKEIIWNKKAFNKYINSFFLWDYVEKKNDEYKVKSLFSPYFSSANYDFSQANDVHTQYMKTRTSDDRNATLLLPNENEISNYLKNVNWAIKRRGIFMAAMLKIAKKYPQCYMEIMKNVLCTEELFSSYECVIKRIESFMNERGKCNNCADYKKVVLILGKADELIKKCKYPLEAQDE